MARGWHQTTVLGNVGRDPEQRYTSSGKAVANFSVAVNEKYKDTETTTWYNVVAWGKTAELCAEYLSKGSQVLLIGRMQNRKWEDREGNKRETAELVADRVQFIGNSASVSKGTHEEPDDHGFDPADDVPF